MGKKDPRVDSLTTPTRISLASQPFAEFLADVARENCPALIEATSASKLVRVYVHGEEIRLVSSSDASDTLGALLESGGVIDGLTRNRAIARLSEGRLNEAEILADEGVDEARLAQARSDLALRIIAEILDWTDGMARFQSGPEMPASRMSVSLNMRDAIRAGVREIQDARRLVERMGGRKALVGRSESDPIEPGSDDERRLLDRLSAKTTLFDLVQTPPLSQSENARILYGLYALGAVRIKPAKQIKVQLRRNQ